MSTPTKRLHCDLCDGTGTVVLDMGIAKASITCSRIGNDKYNHGEED